MRILYGHRTRSRKRGGSRRGWGRWSDRSGGNQSKSSERLAERLAEDEWFAKISDQTRRRLPSSLFRKERIMAVLVPAPGGFAQPPHAPAEPSQGATRAAKGPHYTLPDRLVLLHGKKVTSVRTWPKKRRPEILGLMAPPVYGRTMVGAQKR